MPPPRTPTPAPSAANGRTVATRRAWLASAGRACWGAAATLALPPAGAQAGPVSAPGPGFYDNFAGMQLTDQAGRPLRLDSLRGKVVLFNFIFTACSTVCPVQTLALAQMQQRMKLALRARMQLVSVSLDPLGDTPQTLPAFARRFQVDHSNWSFATGRPDDIERLAQTLALFRRGKGPAPLEDHTTTLWLADAQGVLRMRYAGNPPDVARIETEMGALLALGSAASDRSTRRSP